MRQCELSHLLMDTLFSCLGHFALFIKKSYNVIFSQTSRMCLTRLRETMCVYFLMYYFLLKIT